MPKKAKNKEPEYPFIIDNITFSQESNCCTGTDEREKLNVEFHNGGGGYFYVIKTDMFAFDFSSEEYIKLMEKIKGICASNDIHDEKEFQEYCIKEGVKDSEKSKEENVTCITFNT